MPIEFRCANCQKLLRTPDGTAGREAQCPDCGAITTVPSAGTPGGDALRETAAWESPFASAAPARQTQESENPYQSPTEAGQPAYAHSPGYFPPGYRAIASQRVAGPATALMVTGALGVVAQIIQVFAQLVEMGQDFGGPGQPPAAFGLAIGAVALVPILLSILVIVGAVKMKNLESHGFATASAIIAMIPCFSPCCILGLPFGIWALVVLNEPAVKAAFER